MKHEAVAGRWPWDDCSQTSNVGRAEIWRWHICYPFILTIPQQFVWLSRHLKCLTALLCFLLYTPPYSIITLQANLNLAQKRSVPKCIQIDGVTKSLDLTANLPHFLQVRMQLMTASIICAVRKEGVWTFWCWLSPLKLLLAEKEGRHAVRTLMHAVAQLVVM